MSAVGTRLEQVILELGDPTSPAYRNIRAVLEQSPALMQQMNDALAQGHLKHFALMPETENAGASYDPETRTINLKRSNLLDAKQRDALTFLIGHEIQHGINSGRTRQGLEQFDKNVRGVLESGQPVHDYSSALDQMLAINRSDEANAHIAGWNALVSRVKQGNPDADLSDLGKLTRDVGYVFDFVEVKEVDGRPQFTAKEGFTLNADLSLTPHSRNTEAAAKHYFDKKPDNAQLGHHGNSDYTNYHAAGLVGSVCQYELLNTSPVGEVRLDMPDSGCKRRSWSRTVFRSECWMRKSAARPISRVSNWRAPSSSLPVQMDWTASTKWRWARTPRGSSSSKAPPTHRASESPTSRRSKPSIRPLSKAVMPGRRHSNRASNRTTNGR